MRKLIGMLAMLSATAAGAQSSTTNCYNYGYSVQCNTQTTPDYGAQTQQFWSNYQQQIQQQQQQQQQQMNQTFQNLGTALAARAEQKREQKAAQDAAAQQQAVVFAANAAIAADKATAEPPPADEKAVLLACTVGGHPMTLALYEKHGRIDLTSEGVTKTRVAFFDPASISWVGPVWKSTLNRLDGTYTATGNIMELQSASLSGSCQLATDKRF